MAAALRFFLTLPDLDKLLTGAWSAYCRAAVRFPTRLDMSKVFRAEFCLLLNLVA